MGITVKTARIALLLTVLSILGFGAVPLQAQPDGWTTSASWSGNGAPNRYNDNGHAGIANWYDSVYITRTLYTGNNDPGYGNYSGYHYSSWTSNWENHSGSWSGHGQNHTDPYNDPAGYMLINSNNFSDGPNVNVLFNHGTEKNIDVNRPVGTGEINNNNSGPSSGQGNIELRSILINGEYNSWSFSSSTDLLRIIHGTGSLFLYDNINLTTSNVQFDFDEGVRVHQAGNIHIADGNSLSPFGIYSYNVTPAQRDWRTLFVENVNGTNPNVTISRSVNTNQQSGWQNRTYMDTNSQMTFTYDKGVKFEIFNVNNSAAPVNDPILGGAFYLNNGADIRKGLTGGSSDYYGLLDVYNNRARNGAAFYSEQYLTIQGNTRIHGNVSTSTSNAGSSVIGGGAIFMAGKYYPGRLTFDTSHGHIALYDNHQNNGAVGSNTDLNSIFLAKDTLLQITGTGVYTGNLYIEDGISTGMNNALSYGNNSMTVDLRGQGGQFVQFGALSNSLLNPSSSNGGSVRIINGPFRVLHGGEFRTKGLSATFTIERNDTNDTVGILAGQGLVGAEQGIIVNGILSPDSKNYVIPARVNDSLADNEVKDDGTRTDIGYMTLEGNVLLNGSTIKYDTTPTDAKLKTVAPAGFGLNDADDHVLNADLIRVNEIAGIADTGKIMLSAKQGKNTIDLGTSWNPSNIIAGGKYVIASTSVGIVDAADNNIEVTSDNIMDYFNEIVPVTISQTQNKRAGGSLFVERGLLDTTVMNPDLKEYDIVLQTTNQGNVNLIWTGKTSAQWNDPAINWIRRVKKPDGTILNIDLDFEDGDFVTFNEPDNVRGENVIVISGWTVGGMRVEGGNYHFTGGAITGEANRNFIGIQATGRMDILSAAAAPTKIFFEQENNFEKGTLITGTGAEITIGRDQVFGIYGSNASALETGTIYLDNASAKFITSDGLTGDRVLKNHIELIGNSDLTLDIPDGTKLTISNVDTSIGIGFAGHHGGALFVDAGAKFQRTTNQLLTFEQNTANEGGAIFGIDTLKITGNTLFSENAAVNYGGAIYFDTLQVARGDLTFDTADGDIVFDGNHAITDINNGIYLKGQTKLTINTVNGHNLFLNDSIDFDPTTSGNNWLVKTGDGFVQFTGLNKFDTNLGGSNTGHVEVQNGEFRLAQIPGEALAEFRTGSYGQSAYIAVANEAKIAGSGTFNVHTTRAFAYEFGNGSIIAPDSAVFSSALTGTEQTSTAGHEIGQLTLAGNGANGNVKLTGSIIDIDLGNGINPTNSPGVNGDYILVSNGNIQLTGTDNKVEVRSVPSTAPAGNYLIVHASGLLTSGTSNNTVAELKKHIDSNLDPSGSSARGGTGTLAFGLNGAIVGDTSNANELWIIGYSAGDNMKLYWTGKYDTKWDEASTKNWHVLSPSSSESDFYQYDYVTFDDTVAGVTVANHNAVLTGGDKNVTGMDVVNGSFTITSGNGGNYKIVNNKYGAAMAGTPSGKLIVGGGTSAAELTLGLETQFIEGTELKDNSKITIDNDKALGTYNNANFTAFTDNGTAVTGSKTGYVDVTGDAVIAAAEDHAVANRFHVAANKSLKVDVAPDKKLTVNNVTTSAGTNAQGVVVLENGAKLEKTGSGNLVFTGNSGSETVRVNGASAAIIASAGDIIFNTNTQPAIQAGTGSVTTLTGNTNSRIYLGDTVNVHDFKLNGGVTAVIKNSATIAGNTIIGDGASAGVLFVDNSNFNAAGTFELLKYATVAGNGNIRGNGVTLKGTVDPTSDNYSVANGLIAKNAVNPISQTLTFIGNTTLDGAILKIDLGVANSGIADVIHVTGNISLTADKSTISFTPAGTPDGEYKILDATGTFLVGANIDAMNYFNTAGSSNRLSGYELKFRNSGADVTSGPVNELWLVGYDAPSSMDLYWTGKNGTATDPNWVKRDMAKLNWRDTAANPQHFLDNDHVYFTGDTWVQTRAVKLANDDTYKVNAMDITGGIYTFDPVGAGTKTEIVSAAGDLTVNGNASATFNVVLEFVNLNVGGAAVTLNKENSFTTVNLGGTSTVTLGNEKGLGDNNTVNVAGDAVLKSTVNGNLNNSFVLAGNLTIDTDKNLKLNKALTGTGNFVKDNTGLVEFAAASNITGNTSIKKGEVKFDANYTSAGTFALDTGATVSPGSNATTVTANQFNLKGTVSVDRTSKITFVSLNPVAFDGATLAVDLTSANTAASLINVTGAATINGNANVIDIGMDAAWTDTDYIIVATTGGITKASDGFIPSTTELGQMFTLKQGGATISNTRQTYEVKLNPADTNLLLHLNTVNNEALYWNGSPTNDWSNGNNMNWYEAPNTSATKAVFVAGDFVNFQSDLAVETSVKVGDNQYMTAGMVIDSGNYTFENGTLKRGAISGNMTTGNYASKTGKMVIDNTGTVQFDVATHFVNGIEVKGDRTIKIGNDLALGNTASSNGNEGLVNIAAGKNVTIETIGDRSINNRIVVDSGASLNLVARDGSLNIDNPNGSTVELNGAKLTVDAAEGYRVAFDKNINGTGSNEFLKTGAGDVAFTGANNLSAGSTATIANGKMILENTADSLLVGTFKVNSGATLTGNGKVDAANTTFAAKSIIDPGTDDIGTLTLTGNTTFDGVTYQVQLDGTSDSDKIVTDNISFTGSNTVKITVWSMGTYDIITAAGTMSGSNNWTVDTSLVSNSGRAGASIQQVTKGGLEVLELNTTIANAHLTWTGSSNLNWDGTTMNWTNNDNLGQQDVFMNGDAVFFTGAGQGNVDVTTGLQIGGMTITDGTYNFRGEITGLKGTSTLSDAEGMLNITGGQTTFNNNVNFAGGINVTKGSVTLANDGKLNSGKNIVFGTGTTLSFTPVTGIITAAGKVELNGNVKFGIPATNSVLDVIIAGVALDVPHLESIFSTTSGLNARLATFSDNNKRMSLTYSQITPSEFADINNLGWNEREAAKGITNALNDGSLDIEAFEDLKDYLYSLDSDAQVETILDQFRGTEMAADALTASLWEPWQKVYKQLRTRGDYVIPHHAVNGQAPKFKGRDVWIEGYYRYLDVNGDRNAKKYYEKRGGMVMGLDTNVNHHSTLGISFGYGNPELYTKFGQVKTNDFTLALYGKTQIQSDVYLNIYGGIGFQNYEYKRYETLADYTSQYNGDYDGNSAYISAEVYKPYKWNEAWTLFPLAALDYQRAWSSGFEENGGLFNQKIYKSNVDRFVARIGLDSKLQYSDSVNFLTRLQYGFMMGGDTRASLNTSFVGTGTTMNMRGVHLGRSQIDMGIGGEWYLDQRKCLKFFGDYDLNFGAKSSAQTGQLGLVVQW